MAQAYEYEVIGNQNYTMFASDLATQDAAGWEVIGFSTIPSGTATVYYALLRRRI